MQYSTVRIECIHSGGVVSTGTGYFFKFRENKESGQYVPVVITNKHVIKNSTKGKLIFTIKNKSGYLDDTVHYHLEVKNFESYWKNHPDSEVDLCAMPIASFINHVRTEGRELFLYPWINH